MKQVADQGAAPVLAESSRRLILRLIEALELIVMPTIRDDLLQPGYSYDGEYFLPSSQDNSNRRLVGTLCLSSLASPNPRSSPTTAW